MNFKNIFSLLIALALVMGTALDCWAETITYRITEFNTSTGSFTMVPAGTRPAGSYAWFDNEYGATTGNRYNQIPRNREATLWLEGWDDCTINAVTLSMCSNKTAGTFALVVSQDGEECYKTPTAAFNSDQWFGRWVSKDLYVYVDKTKQLPSPVTVASDAELGITVKGGTQEGSVYLNAITIDYTPGNGVVTESALPWKFEKIEAKGKVNDGDVVMMYRSGSAAGDIDGMDTSHYLDAIGVTSTATIDDPFITLFTATKDSNGHFTLTNQHGQQLGARGEKNLAWDEGVTTWDITMGYDGATIASTNTKYGTMRYNAPIDGYVRFWNYTSKTLPLPNLYRLIGQQDPIVSRELTLPATERTVNITEQDTVALTHWFYPTTTTDQRVTWTSSNERVARVRSGIVELLAGGTAVITATAVDGGSSATCVINVTGAGPAPLPGDVNGDGTVDVSDANILINIILGHQEAIPAADVNSDGTIDISDANAVINTILKP